MKIWKPRKKAEPAPPAEPTADDTPKAPLPSRTRTAAVRKGMLRLVTRNNVVNMVLVVLLSIVAVIFLLGLSQERFGNFTISLAQTDRYKYGIELAESPDFSMASGQLEAEAIRRATNISINDLPAGLDARDGSNNGQSYISYTFYVRNNGKTDFDYRYQIAISEVTRQLDSAVRVAIHYNGQTREVFAKNGANGQPEPGTTAFAGENIIDAGTIFDMKVGTMDKYTVVIWIEGDDPECTDDRLGGLIKMAMSISVIEDEL
ncbi:MAG: hypothetical protein RSB55_03830 [Oscillospiraceae bacterium]